MATVDSISDLPLFVVVILPENSRNSLDVVDRRCLNNGYRRFSTHTDEMRRLDRLPA
jgi:hypothetical protein